MPIYLLSSDLYFPDPRKAEKDGLLAIGGDLSPDRVLLAYEQGIFPWFSDSDPLMWWSPDPRCVLYLDKLKISKSMRNILNRQDYRISFDQAFEEVIMHCGNAPRKEEGTWITNEIMDSYKSLHSIGVAHSVEVWKGDKLVGGLYGLSLGRMFFGESMFSLESNASKLAFVHLIGFLKKNDFGIIDCQIYNPHLGSLGAENIDRDLYLDLLESSLKQDSMHGKWNELNSKE